MTHNILEPLQLAAGSHQAGSGKGCAMNVISWENGDSVITDFPECSDPYLSILVQSFNDDLADIETRILSPEKSMMVLELGHMTVGTSYHELSNEDLVEVYKKMVADPIERCFHDTFEEYIDHCSYNIDKAMLISGSTFHAARAAAYEATNLIATMPRQMRYDFLKKHIQLFRELTGTTEVEVPVEKTVEAVQKMLVCTTV